MERDPLSASKRDPFDRRVLLVALVPSELVGVAETARARVVRSSSRLLKRPAIVAGLDDIAVMGQPIE